MSQHHPSPLCTFCNDFPHLTRSSTHQFWETPLKVFGLFLETTSSPVEASSAAQMEAEPSSHSPSSAFPLLQIGFGCPHRGIVCHVVVSSEQLHLLPVTGKTPLKIKRPSS